MRGKLKASEELAKRALAIYEHLGLMGRAAGVYGNLGIIFKTRGNLNVAEEW